MLSSSIRFLFNFISIASTNILIEDAISAWIYGTNIDAAIKAANIPANVPSNNFFLFNGFFVLPKWIPTNEPTASPMDNIKMEAKAISFSNSIKVNKQPNKNVNAPYPGYFSKSNLLSIFFKNQ